jgi:SAM-dependent methyltransferase
MTQLRRLAGAIARRVFPRWYASRSVKASSAPVIDGGAIRPAPPPERTLPLPEGWTERDLAELMHSFSVDGSAPGELGHYVNDAFWRFLHTWGLVRHEQGRALELGANPYFITWLMLEFTGLELTLANYFGGERGDHDQVLTYVDRDRATRQLDLRSQLFNLEEDGFPFEDGAFKVVVFCEILEHLLVDPLHALREMNRVLSPGGLLVVTTPNVSRLGNVLAMIAGENIYDPYSGFGPYGRHNREYNQHELVKLLRFAGFEEEVAFTANAHPEAYETRLAFDQVMPLVEFRRNDLGQYLFVAARKVSAPHVGSPSWLYRSLPPDELVEG